MQLQHKVLWSILGTILIFGTLASVTTFFVTRNQFIKLLSSNIQQNTAIHAREGYQILSQSRDIAKLLAGRPLIRSYFSTPTPPKDSSVDATYLSSFNTGDKYSAIFLLDAKGNCLISTDPRFVNQNYSFRNYFIESMQGIDSVDFARGVTSQEYGYYFSSPIYDPTDNKKIVGSAVFKFIPKYLEESLTQALEPGHELHLVDRYGVIILSSNQAKILHSLAPLSDTDIKEIVARNQYHGDLLKPLAYTTLLEDITIITESPKMYSLYDDIDQKSEILSFIKIPEFSFYLIYEGNLSTISLSAYQSSLSIAGFVGITAIITLIIILITTKAFIKRQEAVETELRSRSEELEKINGLLVNRELKMIELKQKIITLEEKHASQ